MRQVADRRRRNRRRVASDWLLVAISNADRRAYGWLVAGSLAGSGSTNRRSARSTVRQNWPIEAGRFWPSRSPSSREAEIEVRLASTYGTSRTLHSPNLNIFALELGNDTAKGTAAQAAWSRTTFDGAWGTASTFGGDVWTSRLVMQMAKDLIENKRMSEAPVSIVSAWHQRSDHLRLSCA